MQKAFKWVQKKTDILMSMMGLVSIGTGFYFYDPRLSAIVLGFLFLFFGEMTPHKKDD